MKKTLLLASLIAALGVLAAPAVAQTGHAGLNYTKFDSDFEDYGVDGAVAFDVGGLKLKLDASYVDYHDTDGESFGGTAHLMKINEKHAFGGYAGYVDFDYDNGYVVGGEYARFFEKGTLAVGAGFGKLDDADVDLYGASVQYRHFATDNLRFDVGAGWTNADSSFGDEDIVSVGVGVEYRFGKSPISIGASYEHIEFENDGGELIGLTLRYDFGNGSLKGRDRNGASTFGALGSLGGVMAMY